MRVETIQTPQYTAQVRAADGVRFSASADCPDVLSAQLVGYIRARCDDVLWPGDADAVRALIVANAHDAAIALYFERVGDRWDEESLEVGGLAFRRLTLR